MDYSSLQADVAAYLDRTDLTTRIQTAIGFAEKRLMLDLKFRGVESSTTATLSSAGTTVTPPSDYRSIILLQRPDNTVIERRSISYINQYISDLATATGAPLYYALFEETIHVAPTADAEYVLKVKYYAELEALSGSNTTNYFTDNTPQLLVYATLLEMAPYLHNDPRIPVWENNYRQMVESIMRDNKYYGTDEAVQ